MKLQHGKKYHWEEERELRCFLYSSSAALSPAASGQKAAHLLLAVQAPTISKKHDPESSLQLLKSGNLRLI